MSDTKRKKESVAVDASAIVTEYGAFLTVIEIADILKVSRPIVDGMLRSGKIPAARVGGRQYRVRVDDFLRWWEAEVKTEQRNIVKGCLPK